MSKIWISSDTHFCHNKDFIYKPRGFNSVYEMNETIVKNWNSVVNWDDEIYLLGDVMLNNDEEGCKYLNRLAGKIYILGGNHDTTNRIQRYVNIRPTILYLGLANILKYQGYHFYLSHYPTLTSNYDDDNKPLKKKLINLCGHSHVQNPFYDLNKGLIYHCELDTNNCYPWLLDDIIYNIENVNKGDIKKTYAQF